MIRFVALILVSLGLMVAHAEQRIALLIGNESYGTPGLNVLENPHGDVDRVAAALRQAGFTDVTVLKDLDEGATRAALQAFRGKLRAGGSDAIGFFYYSGHGASLEQGRQRVSYLIPTGNPVEFADDLETYGVEIQREIELLEATGAGAVFFVVDACRNTLTRRASMGGGGTKGVGVVSAPPGLLIAYSAADGQFADDDAIFSTALSEEIRRSGQTAETAFSNVARAVGAKKPGFDRLPVIQPRLSKTVCFNGCEIEGRSSDWISRVRDQEDALAKASRLDGHATQILDKNILLNDQQAKDVLALFEEACALGYAPSCGSIVYIVDEYFDSDSEIKQKYLRGCDRGHSVWCFVSGLQYRLGGWGR